MPYASAAQRGYMHVHHPEIAERWDREEHSMKKRMRSNKRRKKMPAVPLEGAIKRRLGGGLPGGPKMMASGRSIKQPGIPAGPAVARPRPGISPGPATPRPRGGGGTRSIPTPVGKPSGVKPQLGAGGTPFQRAVVRRLSRRTTSAIKPGATRRRY